MIDLVAGVFHHEADPGLFYRACLTACIHTTLIKALSKARYRMSR